MDVQGFEGCSLSWLVGCLTPLLYECPCITVLKLVSNNPPDYLQGCCLGLTKLGFDTHSNCDVR